MQSYLHCQNFTPGLSHVIIALSLLLEIPFRPHSCARGIPVINIFSELRGPILQSDHKSKSDWQNQSAGRLFANCHSHSLHMHVLFLAREAQCEGI